MVSTHYVLRRGAHVSERCHLSRLPRLLRRLCTRHIDATSRDDAGLVVGAVWRNDGQWAWYCELDAGATKDRTSSDGD